jgi:hypothetical protein
MRFRITARHEALYNQTPRGYHIMGDSQSAADMVSIIRRRIKFESYGKTPWGKFHIFGIDNGLGGRII